MCTLKQTDFRQLFKDSSLNSLATKSIASVLLHVPRIKSSAIRKNSMNEETTTPV